jgi:beta-glucanase (GH16 family)
VLDRFQVGAGKDTNTIRIIAAKIINPKIAPKPLFWFRDRYAQRYNMPLILVCISIAIIFSNSTQAAPPPGYKLVFDEEFSEALSASNWGSPTAKWMAHTPYAGDFGDAYFTGPNEPNIPSPFSVNNGILTITAYQDRNHNNHWRSGLLSSVDTHGNGFSVALGYFECSMKLPSGAGVWPAFWLAGVNGVDRNRTTNAAEIDVLEEYGVDSTIAHQNVHVWKPKGGQSYSKGKANTLRGMTTDFHVYGCLIAKDFIRFYFDGLQVWQTPTPTEALEPLYLMIDLALGGGWPIDQTPNPSYLYVDYIRVYAPPHDNTFSGAGQDIRTVSDGKRYQ